jgi:hypothetical protein
MWLTVLLQEWLLIGMNYLLVWHTYRPILLKNLLQAFPTA